MRLSKLETRNSKPETEAYWLQSTGNAKLVTDALTRGGLMNLLSSRALFLYNGSREGSDSISALHDFWNFSQDNMLGSFNSVATDINFQLHTPDASEK